MDIAVSMMSNPQIIFLDEPTVGMDIQSRKAMWEMSNTMQRFGVRKRDGSFYRTLIAPVKRAAIFMSGITYTISMYLPNEVIFETVMNAIVLPLFL